jgi:hypothetical protein
MIEKLLAVLLSKENLLFLAILFAEMGDENVFYMMVNFCFLPYRSPYN